MRHDGHGLAWLTPCLFVEPIALLWCFLRYLPSRQALLRFYDRLLAEMLAVTSLPAMKDAGTWSAALSANSTALEAATFGTVQVLCLAIFRSARFLRVFWVRLFSNEFVRVCACAVRTATRLFRRFWCSRV